MTDTENVIGVGDLCKKDTYARTDFNAQLVWRSLNDLTVTCLVYWSISTKNKWKK